VAVELVPFQHHRWDLQCVTHTSHKRGELLLRHLCHESLGVLQRVEQDVLAFLSTHN
jgi:hypothetical protein